MATESRKVLWITGASSGIGWYTVLEAARRGYSLALTARRIEKLQELKEQVLQITGRPDEVLVVPGDVTVLLDMERGAQQILEHFGKIDILLGNAGGHTPTTGEAFDVQSYKELFDLNFFGVLNCIQAALPSMKERGEGHIVGVSSVAGYRALPTAACYGASKSALTYFLESLRFDLAPLNIAVTVVSPGFVRTPLTDRNTFPMPCMVEPEFAARTILNGIERRDYEIHFPKRFTYFLKFLRFLPGRLYHALVSWSVVP